MNSIAKFLVTPSLLLAFGLVVTACGGEEKHSAETMDEHGVTHDQGLQMEEMEHSNPTTELSRIEEMSRQDFQAYAKMSDQPQLENLPAEAKQHIAALTGEYLKLKDALVEGNQDQAARAAQSMNKALATYATTSLPEETQNVYASRADKLKEDTQALANTDKMDEQRAIFVTISKNIAELNQAYDTDKKLYYQYCPMAFENKGAYWLSSEEKIMNPYFGDMMLNCGRVEKEL